MRGLNGKTWLLLGLAGAIIALVVARQLRDGLVDTPSPANGDDYYMSHYTMTVFNAEGHREYILRGPDLRRAAAGDYVLESPEVEWMTTDGPPWVMQAQKGRLDAPMQNARLVGEVVLSRASSPPARIETADLESHLPSREAHTAAPVLMRQGASEIRGIGLRADLSAARLTLLAQVRGSYAP